MRAFSVARQGLFLACSGLGLCLGSFAWAQQGPSNEQVLRTWQQQTGQNIWQQDGGKLEFRGAASLDVYDNQVRVPSGNTGAALSGLRDGSFARGIFQGDARSTNSTQDTSYVQGVFTSTNDRGVLPRYANQINSFQMGRAGVGYQMAFGDVVAGYSSLSSNLGLRGLLASREIDKFSVSGFAGVVAESWEALSKRDPLDNLPARTQYLRDVYGLKAEQSFTANWRGFATAQHFGDRVSSASPVASTINGVVTPIRAPVKGEAVSLGLKYQEQNAQLVAEYAASRSKDLTTGNKADGDALVLDGTYRWQVFGLRAGFHDLEPEFASNAQSVAPGIRETYVGGDWQITPQLLWNVDLRESATRLVGSNQASELDTVGNRLAYSFANIAGLSVNLSDTRNRGKDNLGNPVRTDQTQLGLAYGASVWNTNLSVGQGKTRNPQNPVSDGNTRSWQAALGRNWTDAQADLPASYQLTVQATAFGQSQKFAATGTGSRSTSVGLNASLNTQRWGLWSAAWQRQLSTQPTVGAPDLWSSVFSFDWARQIGEAWSLKAFARANRRNHGDLNLQADERTLGLQAGYKW
jgi:hypothetical protein